MRTRLPFGAPKEVASSSTSVQPKDVQLKPYMVVGMTVMAWIAADFVKIGFEKLLLDQKLKVEGSQPRVSIATVEIDQESGKETK